MRAVSFVDRLEFDFEGSVFKDAVALGDVDNDGGNELVVGNAMGDLAVFKHEDPKPFLIANDLGMITVVGVGDLFNIGKNVLVVLCGDGWCRVFDSEEKSGERLRAVHVQRIPANTKSMLLADVNGDGKNELVVGLTDRVVRTYQWISDGTDTAYSGKLVGINKWEFANQIGSVSVHQMPEGETTLLVAHPGGTFVRLKCQEPHEFTEDDQQDDTSQIPLDYHPLASARMRNPNVSSEIVGCINEGANKKEGKGTPYSIATLDGTLMLVQDEEILWSLQVDHQLFALTKLDVTGDGRDEMIACSWDGQTYIVNQERVSVRFQFEESVSTFYAGHYALSSERSEPCFIYVTFNNKIYVYYGIKIKYMATQSLLKTVRENEKVVELMGQLGIDADDDDKVKKVIRKCLYERDQ